LSKFDHLLVQLNYFSQSMKRVYKHIITGSKLSSSQILKLHGYKETL